MLSHPTAPILEFDPAREAILEPHLEPLSRPPVLRVVLCFFLDVLNALVAEGRLEQVYSLGSERGPQPVYLLRQNAPTAQETLVMHPGVGAPLAAGYTDELIALGGRFFMACGGCGVLRQDIVVGHPVILTSAVRDEGTSYHYLAPEREATPDPTATAALEAVCQERGIDYRLGKAWTTDAFYRETVERRARRMAEGCDVVEMEAAAFFAVAQFRGVSFGQIVYGGDLVVPEGWDSRGWISRVDARRLLFDIAVSAVFKMGKE
jgi:uridine phosphorylase